MVGGGKIGGVKEAKRIIKRIDLNPTTSDKVYKQLVEICERDGVFLSCGNPDNKYIIVKFEDAIDEAAWICAKGLATPVFIK